MSAIDGFIDELAAAAAAVVCVCVRLWLIALVGGCHWVGVVVAPADTTGGRRHDVDDDDDDDEVLLVEYQCMYRTVRTQCTCMK